jgi:conjugative transfer region lipoprotein (TIGR03751 family)
MYKKISIAVLISVLMSSCATKPPAPPFDAPDVKESYMAAMSKKTDYVVHKGATNKDGQQAVDYVKPKKVAIPNIEGAMQNPQLLKRQADFNADFPMLPNPQMLLYIYPHFQDGLPLHGNWTTFTMYANNHYALPSEVSTGNNLSTYK